MNNGTNKNIGIVTLWGNFNYGNRLQNLAIVKLVKDRGYNPITIICKKGIVPTILHKVKQVLLFWKPINQRAFLFDEFNDEYIPHKTYYSYHSILRDKKLSKYTCFIVGSDQVWNPELHPMLRDFFFLRFTSRSKRVSLSPSFGVYHLSSEHEPVYKKLISDIEFLSCREKAGTDEIIRLTGRKCTQLIDPTLAISSDEWRSMISNRPIPEKSYCLCFFLGNLPSALLHRIEEFAVKNNCIIINMQKQNDPYYVSDPLDLVRVIDNATMVFTDSFHALALSINLNTPFYVFDRMSEDENGRMTSRIHSITQQLLFEKRYIRNLKRKFEFETTCDFSKANEILHELRVIFYNYIDSIFKYYES